MGARVGQYFYCIAFFYKKAIALDYGRLKKAIDLAIPKERSPFAREKVVKGDRPFG
jgi:hypothetical protein